MVRLQLRGVAGFALPKLFVSLSHVPLIDSDGRSEYIEHAIWGLGRVLTIVFGAW